MWLNRVGGIWAPKLCSQGTNSTMHQGIGRSHFLSNPPGVWLVTLLQNGTSLETLWTPTVLYDSCSVAEVITVLLSVHLRLQVLSNDKTLEVGKVKISEMTWWFLAALSAQQWCAKGVWSQLVPAQESLLCTPLPNYTFSGISLVAWSLPWQEYLHATNECHFSFFESQLLNIYQHIAGYLWPC